MSRPTIYRGTTVRVYSKPMYVRGRQGVVSDIVNVADVLNGKMMRLYYVKFADGTSLPLILRELVKDIDNP